MGLHTIFIILTNLLIIISCNSKESENIQHNSVLNTLKDTINTYKKQNIQDYDISQTLEDTLNEVTYDERRNSLKLKVLDTIKKSKLYFFSNPHVKDLFQMTIEPGMVKNSKAELKIIAADYKVIYKQTFDAFYFIRGIYEPDTIPSTGGQLAYEKFMDNYWKSITLNQFEEYFKKSYENFYDHIYPLKKDEYETIEAWKDIIIDKKFLNEVLTDSSINLIDITCFYCDEGGIMMGYSNEQKKVVTLFEHD